MNRSTPGPGRVAAAETSPDKTFATAEWRVRELGRRRRLALLLTPAKLSAADWDELAWQLEHGPYISEVFIAVEQGDRAALRRLQGTLGHVRQPCWLLWAESDQLQGLRGRIREAGFDLPKNDRAELFWLQLACLCERSTADYVLMHSTADIPLGRRMWVALSLPLLDPGSPYELSKTSYGQSFRVNAERLLLRPLLSALRDLYGPSDYLDFLDSFDHPLGEAMAFRRALASQVPISGQMPWSLNLLNQFRDKLAHNRICQTGPGADSLLAQARPVPSRDTITMIVGSLLAQLRSEGAVMASNSAQSLRYCYLDAANRYLHDFRKDRLLDGGHFDLHRSERDIEGFANGIYQAATALPTRDQDSGGFPAWRRVSAAFPALGRELVEAVEADSAYLPATSTRAHKPHPLH